VVAHCSAIPESHALASSTAQEMQNPRAGRVHRPRNAESHVQEESIAQESRILTRGSRLPLGNCVISRSGPVHRSGIAESHAQERSTTQKLQNPTRSSSSPHTSSD